MRTNNTNREGGKTMLFITHELPAVNSGKPFERKIFRTMAKMPERVRSHFEWMLENDGCPSNTVIGQTVFEIKEESKENPFFESRSQQRRLEIQRGGEKVAGFPVSNAAARRQALLKPEWAKK